MPVLMPTMRWRQSVRHYSRSQRNAWALLAASCALAVAVETGAESSLSHSLRHLRGAPEGACQSFAQTLVQVAMAEVVA
jgi:hypothetical protein